MNAARVGYGHYTRGSINRKGAIGPMSAQFRNGDSRPDLDNKAHEAEAEHPPALKFGIGLCEFVFGLFCNFAQVITTTIAILAMIIGSNVKVVSVLDVYLQFGYMALIASVIGISIQLFLHMNAQSMSSTMSRLRQIQHFNIKSMSSLQDVQNAVTLKSIFFGLAIIADLVSDATFVNLFTSNGFVVLFWIVFMSGSSTVLMYDGATRMWGALEDYKDYRAYHHKHEVRTKEAS